MSLPAESWTCPACGAVNRLSDRACVQCGAAAPAGEEDPMALLRDARLMRGARTTGGASRETIVNDPDLPFGNAPPTPAPRSSASQATASMPLTAVPATAPARANADGGMVSRATMLLPAARAVPSESTVETGSVPVAVVPAAPSEVRHAEGPLHRMGPMLAMLLGAAAVLGLAARWLAGTEAPTAAEAAGAAPTESSFVDLPAVPDFASGLSDDNKESVLYTCNRISSNPNDECRTSHLRDIGEYPAQPAPQPALRVHRFEVSNAEWQTCVEQGGCTPQDWDACRFYSAVRYEFGREVPELFRQPDRPAVCVTYLQAEAYCAAQGMRIPTAAEWERVARNGDDRLYPWGEYWAPGVLNWAEFDLGLFPIHGRLDGEELIGPVTAYADGATPEGVYNLLGNAAEWVQPLPPLDADGSGAAVEALPGVRGGSFADHVLDMRPTRRVEIPADQARTTVGFRCVADLPG